MNYLYRWVCDHFHSISRQRKVGPGTYQCSCGVITHSPVYRVLTLTETKSLKSNGGN